MFIIYVQLQELRKLRLVRVAVKLLRERQLVEAAKEHVHVT